MMIPTYQTTSICPSWFSSEDETVDPDLFFEEPHELKNEVSG